MFRHSPVHNSREGRPDAPWRAKLDMANPTVETPPGAPAPESKPKPNVADALKKIFTAEDPDPQRIIARRRRFVMAGVLGFLTVNLLMFLRFFFPRALYEPKTQFLIGY